MCIFELKTLYYLGNMCFWRSLRCSLCGDKFFTKRSLYEHLSIHDVEGINSSVISGLSPVASCDSLETVLIHDTYMQSDNHSN